jgi:hypothetical protein
LHTKVHPEKKPQSKKNSTVIDRESDSLSITVEFMTSVFLQSSLAGWAGKPAFSEGDTLGLLLDGWGGTLTVYKNGVRLGVAVHGLTGQVLGGFKRPLAALGLCRLRAVRRSLRLSAKPPPIGWRDDESVAELAISYADLSQQAFLQFP